MLGEARESNAIFLKIIGGRIAQKVEAGTPGAVKREYENDAGDKVVTYDKFYNFIQGYITGLTIVDGQFGSQLVVTVFDNGEEYRLGINADSNYFTSFCEKIPNIDPKKEVTISAWDFIPDGATKSKKGVTIIQDGEKIKGAYFDFDKKEAKLGLPSVSQEEAKGYDTDDWKIHFTKVKKFYKKEVERLSPEFTIDNVPEDRRGPGYNTNQTQIDTTTTTTTASNKEEEISVEDIPF